MFVAVRMSCLCCLCLFAHIGVQHILFCVLCFVCLSLVYSMVPVSLDCTFLISPSEFPKVYSILFRYRCSMFPWCCFFIEIAM